MSPPLRPSKPATNEGVWTWGTWYEQFQETNGNPGRYLRASGLADFTPRASTSFGIDSVFTGNYRERNVASVGIDMAIPSVDGNVTGRTVTLILLNDNGTPDDLTDDWGAFTVTAFPIPPTGRRRNFGFERYSSVVELRYPGAFAID
jgi:hypothetical protein